MNKRTGTAKGRHFLIWGLLGIAFVGLSSRLAELHTFQDDFLQLQGDKRSIRTMPIATYRGMILDRHGEALAVSTPVQSAFVNPKKADFSQRQWRDVAKLLYDGDSSKIERIQANPNRSFVYLARQLPPKVASKIEKLNLEGVHLQTEYRRYYPTAEVSAQLLGRVNIDHEGREGLELAFEHHLSGLQGKQTILRNRLGQTIDQLNERQARPGKDLVASIDSRLQYIAYRELVNAVQKHQAKSGTVVVLDAETSEVLAMANAPTYNPNTRLTKVDGRLRNRAVTDQFEPGSVLKPFSMMHVLASGQYYPHTMVDTSPGWTKVGHDVVKDIRNYGQIELSTIIQKSSNVGITKLLLSLPPQPMVSLLHDVGFGQSTFSGFPGEASGRIQASATSNPFALATLGFGYGISATPLQIANAYSVIASGGIKRKPTFVKSDVDEGFRVVSKDITQAITSMLVATTDATGTAKSARVPGYVVAGKTGTVRKVGPYGYEKDKHLALFAGFAPAYDPKVVIVVVVDEPSAGQYYGGQVAAPVFSKVMSSALRLMDVAPYGTHDPEFLLVKK